MDIERDLFTVGVGKGGADDALLLRAVRDLGYEPTIAEPAAAAPPTSRAADHSGETVPEPVRSALDRARREGKLVLVDFHAPWCGPCRRMIEETFADERVKRVLDERFVLIKVDTDALPEVARRFAVASIPDVRILAADGKELIRVDGFRSAADFLPILTRLASSRVGEPELVK